MKTMNDLTEQEKIALFQVEDLEERFEMWFDNTNGGCGHVNTLCPSNPSCGNPSCTSNYSC